jgi:translation initiation factor IF-2
MSRMKVFELAKKLKIEDETLLQRIRDVGLGIEDATETLESEEVKILEEMIRKEKTDNVVEERIKPTVIRRRAKEKPAASPEDEVAPEVIEETPAVETEADREPRDEAGPRLKTVEKEQVSAPRIISKEVVKERKPKQEEQEARPAKTAQVPGVTEEKPATPQGPSEQREERVLGKRLKTVSKEEMTEVVRPKIIHKPQHVEIEAADRKRSTTPAGAGAGAGADKKAVTAPVKKEADKKRKRKKKKGDVIDDRAAIKRPVKKREVLITTEPAGVPDEAARAKPWPASKKMKKAPKPVRRVMLKTVLTTPKASKRVIKIEEVISVGDLAKRMGIKASDLIKKLMELGTMATINKVIDLDTASIIAHDFGYEVENIAYEETTFIKEVEDKEEDLSFRPPVVTIMGHVDHGKTTLLDAIRETNVVDGEFGGITQHIGAYDVDIKGKKIVFLDTPGHEAFTTMRARGAQVTDIVVLVVAADDGVMPQTVEAVNHAKAAGVPIIVAVNKIDKPDAKPERIRKELIEYGLVSEDLGGETIYVALSAKKRQNISELLEMILIQSEVLELRANPDKQARGVVIEAMLDRGRGPIATVLVKDGTLKVGDYFVTGLHSGRVRALINDQGAFVEEAGPSIPVAILGLSGVPLAGDPFSVVDNEKTAKEVVGHRQQKVREKEMVMPHARATLEEFYQKMKEGVKELKLIIKGDVQGSVEALSESLVSLSNEEVKVVIVHGGTGSITESDVMLASASEGVIIGFSVRPEPKVMELAEFEKVEIKLYNIIYDCVDDIKRAITGMLAPKLVEKTLGHAEVREIFSIPKAGSVAGSYVTDGKIVRGSRIRLIRDKQVIFDGKMESLKRFKEDTKEVASGYECGIKIENFNDFKPNDIIESYMVEEVAAEL